MSSEHTYDENTNKVENFDPTQPLKAPVGEGNGGVVQERVVDEENQENLAVHHHPEESHAQSQEETPTPKKLTRVIPEPQPDSPDRYEEVDLTEHKDADALAQEEIVKNSTPTTELEIALTKILERKQALIDRITGEISKLKSFVRKRKQTYKRKRKEDGAPTRALSAYNMFIKE